MNDTEVQALLEIVERLTTLDSMTRETTELALQAPLEREGCTGFFEVLRGLGPDGSPFEVMEVRVPRHGARGGVFVGRLRSSARISEAQLRDRLGTPPRLRFSLPRQQRSLSLSFSCNGVEVTFGFDLTSRLLQQVTVDHTPRAPVTIVQGSSQT